MIRCWAWSARFGGMDMVDRIPKGQPLPHCTNRKCKYHNHMSGPWPVRKAGFYTRKSDRRSAQRSIAGHVV